MPSPALAAERDSRIALWLDLNTRGLTRDAESSALSTVRLPNGGELYSGQRGIWRDKARLSACPETPEGVTVTVRSTGEHYEDQVEETAIIYSYPSTSHATTDEGEITATKAAGEFSIPLFVITDSERTPGRRDIHLGWVFAWDDDAGIFEIRFDTGDGSGPFAQGGATHTRFATLQKYGQTCAVCGTREASALAAVPLHLDAADENEHLVLCAIHRRMLERKLFRFDPDSTAVVPRAGLKLAEDLGITFPDLNHLKDRPAREALARLQ